MDELVQWLRAQLDEEERVASGCSGMAWLEHPKNWVSAPPLNRVALVVDDGDRGHIVRHDPARVLREIDAKRQQVAWCTGVIGDRDLSRYGEPGLLKDDPEPLAVTLAVETLRLLALPYADRPGYREEWQP
jgi:hypothetical protein